MTYKIQMTFDIVVPENELPSEFAKEMRTSIDKGVSNELATYFEKEFEDVTVTRVVIRDNAAVGTRCEDLVQMIQRPEEGWK